MPENGSAATDLDLISYLQAIPDAHMRRGVRIPVQAENLLLFGPTNVGKTHLAIAIPMAMIEQDQDYSFFPATALVQLRQMDKVRF